MEILNNTSITPIGGYFELERFGKGGGFPHVHGVKLNTGRNALEYILSSINKVSKVYLPYYTCEVVLEPFKKLRILYNFYHIDQNLEIAEDIKLQNGEYILYTNYFGIKDGYIKKIADKYKRQLIVDCAQALFASPIQDIKSFYSPRKFVGIPDGAIAYTDEGINPLSFGVDESENRLSHLYLRLEKGPQAGYVEFRNNAAKLKNQPILNMSLLTRGMIDKIEFDDVKLQRIKNFKYLHEKLESSNLLGQMISQSMDSFVCPMVYPYWTTDKSLKLKLIKEQVFVATYWPNVLEWTSSDMVEYDLANNCLAIPCDQRYGKDEMSRIIELICK